MIVLFKEGTSHVYEGITCQIQIVNEFGFEPFLKQGWVLNPKDLYKDDEGKTPKSSKEKEKKGASSQVTAKDLRSAADKRLKASGLSKTSTTAASFEK